MIWTFIAMPKSRSAHPLIPPRKVVRLQGLFQPDGGASELPDSIHDLWIEVQDHLNQVEDRELAREEAEWKELSDAIDELKPLISSVLLGERDSETVSDDVVKLVPKKELRKKVYDWYVEVLDRKPEDVEESNTILEAARQEAAINKRIAQCRRKIHASLTCLYEMIGSDAPGAAEALVEVATHATFHVSLATSAHPGIMKKAAAMNTMWPVMAYEEPGWEKTAANQIAELELGKGMIKFNSRLRKVRGSDVHLPARRWAKAAVCTIDETRWRAQLFLHLLQKLGGSEQWATFSIKRGWDIEEYPSWVPAATKLEPFSVETYDSWKALVREIIREQVPDFHLLPDWTTQRATAEANGRSTPGEIQNAILDDIVSALKRLAPDASC
jgi:hypothetical protein